MTAIILQCTGFTYSKCSANSVIQYIYYQTWTRMYWPGMHSFGGRQWNAIAVGTDLDIEEEAQ